MTVKTILVVDDDQGFARSLANMLVTAGYQICVSNDPTNALVQARTQPVDCALIDYNLGATLGTALISRLNELGHSFPKIMITGYGDVRTATLAMKLGAADFVEKPFDATELLGVIEGAISKARVSAHTQESIMEARRLLNMLTDREREIVDAIVAGNSSKQIAEALSLSPRTVDVHRANILQKLRFSNTASLVRLAVLAGMGPPHN